MANRTFNITLPEYQADYGSDWEAFLSVTEDETDRLVSASWRIPTVADIDRMSGQQVEKALQARKIAYNASDTISQKKLKLRFGNSKHRYKSLADFYLDIQEAVVGVRGTIHLMHELFPSAWGSTMWSDATGSSTDMGYWTTETLRYEIYIDCKTVDMTKINEILELYRQPMVLPAFYKIYLVDSSKNILGEV